MIVSLYHNKYLTGIAGALNVTEKMEALASALNMNKVYAGWEKLAYPSLKSLGVWMPDLVMRVDQLKAWTDNIDLLRSTWYNSCFLRNRVVIETLTTST